MFSIDHLLFIISPAARLTHAVGDRCAEGAPPKCPTPLREGGTEFNGQTPVQSQKKEDRLKERINSVDGRGNPSHPTFNLQG